MGQSYKLKIISVSDINWKPNRIHFPGHDIPNLYVAIDIDGKTVHQTNPSREWDTEVTLDRWIVHLPSLLSRFSIKSTFSSKCLAKREMVIAQLLGTDEGQKDFSVTLNLAKGKNTTETPGPTLVVHLTSITHLLAGKGALAKATEDIETLQSTSTSSTVENIVNTGVNNSDLLFSLKTVLSRLQIVLEIGAKLAKARN
ncbi:hypothetical protein BDP27DRAFT_1431146 [Rhodocollybia butyracea]|uniref:Uncharacterized protein n=1 Tax=Rhodocollybia butyracea TaxID=206335 RepID=A0A9P5PCB0_9AGAR|nr:hypothetical protein BDP27DRAFT_1431146 [Rhodocollybia butyracea]